MSRLNGWLRIRILERDHFTCVYCGRKPPEVALEVDHVLPRSRGGEDDATNLVTACRQCNNGKRAGLISLPDTIVLAPLPDKRTRRIQHVAAIERADAIRTGRTVYEVIAAGRFGSLGSGPSTMGLPDQRLYRAACDLCTYKADTVHFVPWVVGCHDVLFACPAHDPGGYWTLIETFDTGDYPMRRHVLAKNDGGLALALLNERLNGRKPFHQLRVNWRESGGEQIVRRWA